MNILKKLVILFSIGALSACGQGGGKQKQRSFEHLKDPAVTGKSALKAPAPLNPMAQTLEYQAELPDPKDTAYLKVESRTQDGKEIVHISASKLILAPGHKQGVWELIHQNEAPEKIILEAYEIELNELIKLPVQNLTIRAELMQVGQRGQIDLRPAPLPQAKQGQDGKAPERADLIFAVKNLKTAFDKQIVINASGGRGQKAGEGRPGKAGRSVRSLGGQIVQKCKSVCVQRIGHGPGGSSMLSFQDARPNSSCIKHDWACDVKNFKWPTNGQNASAPGRPGPGGDAALIRVSSIQWIPHIKAQGGKAGEEAPTALGGAPGTPNPAVRIKDGHKSTKRLKKGADASAPKVNLEAIKGKEGDFLESSYKLELKKMGRVFELHLDYLKDLYINGHYKLAFSKMKSFRKTLKKAPNKSSQTMNIQAQSMRLFTRMQQGLDFFGLPRTSAPMHSVEGTGLNFKSKIRKALRYNAFNEWLKQNVNNKKVKTELNSQQDFLYQEKTNQIKRYEQATQKLTLVQQRGRELEKQYLAVLKGYETQKLNLRQQALGHLSAKRYSTLEKVLRSSAALASVIPVEQTATGPITQSLEAFIAIQDAQGSFNLKQDSRLINTRITSNQLLENLKTWKHLVSGRKLDQLQNLNKEELDNKLEEVSQMARPVYRALDKQAQIWQRPKITRQSFEKEIKHLESVSPEFNGLAKEIKKLAKLRGQYLKEFNQTLQNISGSQTRITQIIYDMAAFSSDLSFVNSKASSDVLEAVEKRAKLYQEELLSYKAQLVRTYHYKNLRAYPYQLNLDKTKSFLMALMKNKDSSSLSRSELKQAELAYIEELSSIFKTILDSTPDKGPRQEKQVVIRLTEDDKKALSQRKLIYIDLSSRGLYSENEEEILIEGLQVSYSSVTSNQSFDLKIEHEGQGLIEKQGEEFYFNYKNRLGRTAFKWGHHFDPENQHNSSHPPLMEREENLFLNFMADTFAPRMAQTLNISTRPAGKASLKLKIQGASNVSINELELELNYSFYEGNR